MENIKKNPLSLQLNADDFLPASNEEKQSLVTVSYTHLSKIEHLCRISSSFVRAGRSAFRFLGGIGLAVVALLFLSLIHI